MSQPQIYWHIYINYNNINQNRQKMEILQWVKRQTGKLADNVKDYKFFVKSEPNFIDSSTTLILTTFANRDELSTIPCVYKWSRIKNGLLAEVPQFKGNSFICEPSDIGSIIQAQITSTDGAHPGTAVIKFGPVKLDVLIKKQIQHSLTSGSMVLNVDLVQKDESKQCQIKITEQNIKISHCNSNNQYVFDYTLGQPRIEANIKQPTKAQIFFNQKYEAEVVKFTNALFGFQQTNSANKSNERKIQLKFANRSLKDNFLLILKAFNTKKAMKTSAIISKIENSNVDLSKNQNFDYVLQIQSLRADLVKLARLNDKYLAQKRTYYQQARKLEKQLEQVIVTWTKIAEGKCKNQTQLDQSISQLREKKDEVMERKLHALMRENQTLRDRIQFMNQQLGGGAKEVGSGMIRSNSGGNEQVASSRGGFIKKRNIPQVAPVNAFDNILNNLNDSQIKDPSEQDRLLLVKKLNQSMAKVAKLQDKVRQLKVNQTAMLDNSQISVLSMQPNKKLNLTTMELNSQEKQKFLAEIEQLRRKNVKLTEQNSRIMKQKSEIIMNSSRVSQARQEDVKLQRSRVSNVSGRVVVPNPQIPKVSSNNASINYGNSQAELKKRIEQLTQQNENLKEQIQRLIIEKQLIQKEKSAIEAKYKKKMTQLSSQNSVYKRNQDALNRSQNLSMEMQAYNQEQTNLLKEEVRVLTQENKRIQGLYKKAMEELKQTQKAKEQNVKLSTSVQEVKKGDISIDRSQNQNQTLY